MMMRIGMLRLKWKVLLVPTNYIFVANINESFLVRVVGTWLPGWDKTMSQLLELLNTHLEYSGCKLMPSFGTRLQSFTSGHRQCQPLTRGLDTPAKSFTMFGP